MRTQSVEQERGSLITTELSLAAYFTQLHTHVKMREREIKRDRGWQREMEDGLAASLMTEEGPWEQSLEIIVHPPLVKTYIHT